MVFYLSEAEKFLIIIFATSLFLLTVVITVCVVSPICLINKLFNKLCCNENSSSKKNAPQKQQIITPESKHFQLKVVPLYGSQNESKNGQPHLERLSSEEIRKRRSESEKRTSSTSASVSSVDSDSKVPLVSAKVRFGIRWHAINESSVRLEIKVDEVSDLQVRGYRCEPSVYMIIGLSTVGGIRNRRKSSVIAKAAISFRTLTAKRGLNAVFNETFVTSDLPKSILKEGRLKIKLMDEERYSNDYCCGELSLPLKKFLKSQENCETNETHTFSASKECKGEIMFGVCYLPTSRRVTFNVVKASLMGHSPGNNNSNYYVRILMFVNGKLNKKKKTTTNEKMNWKGDETLTFDMANSTPDEVAFMLVLSASKDPIINPNSSPSSPETPDVPSGGSKKDRHIGHCIVGDTIWRDMKEQPRKQISLCSKLI